MPRKKVTLAYILNNSKRRATFNKRRKGLMKKVSEISTLCGIEACAIIYSPYGTQPDVWPSHSGAHRVIKQFKSLPEMEQNKRMFNPETFLRQRMVKLSEQLRKQISENRENDVTRLMNQCLTWRELQNLMGTDLNDLEWLVVQNGKETDMRIEAATKGKMQEGGSHEKAPENVVLQGENQGMDFALADEGMQRPEWFTEWINAQSEEMGLGHSEEVTMQF